MSFGFVSLEDKFLYNETLVCTVPMEHHATQEQADEISTFDCSFLSYTVHLPWLKTRGFQRRADTHSISDSRGENVFFLQ
jgi:hypothetical protein